MKTLILTLVLAITSLAHAGDGSTYKSLGFSSDGKYFAFMQDGEHDGSGFYYAAGDVIEVATNKLVKRAYAGGEDPEGDYYSDDLWNNEEAYEALKQEIRSELFQKLNLKKYGLHKPEMGQTLISRNPYDTSRYTSTSFTFNTWPQGGVHAPRQDYVLNLNLVNTHNEYPEEHCWYGLETKMIDLSLTINPQYRDEEARRITLQKDTRLPGSRECTFDYWITGVESLNEKYIAVILRYQQPGFEGPNERVMAVTAKIN